MNKKIKPRWANGDPLQSDDCDYKVNDKCGLVGCRTYLSPCLPVYRLPCWPALKEQRDELLAENNQLKIETEDVAELMNRVNASDVAVGKKNQRILALKSRLEAAKSALDTYSGLDWESISEAVAYACEDLANSSCEDDRDVGKLYESTLAAICRLRVDG